MEYNYNNIIYNIYIDIYWLIYIVYTYYMFAAPTLQKEQKQKFVILSKVQYDRYILLQYLNNKLIFTIVV